MIKPLLLLLICTLIPGCIGGAPSFEPANVTAEQEANASLQLLSFAEIRFDVREAGNMANRLDKLVDKATGKARFRAELAKGIALFLEGDFQAEASQLERKKALNRLREGERALGVSRAMDSGDPEIWLFQALTWGRAAGLDRNGQSELLKKFHGTMRALSRLGKDYKTPNRWLGKHWEQDDFALYLSRLYCQAMAPYFAMDYQNTVSAGIIRGQVQALNEGARFAITIGDINGALGILSRFRSGRFRNSPFYGEGLWLLRSCLENKGASLEELGEIDKLVNEYAPQFKHSAILSGVKSATELPHGSLDLAQVTQLIINSSFEEARAIIHDALDDSLDKRKKIRSSSLDRAAREYTLAMAAAISLWDPESKKEQIVQDLSRLLKIYPDSHFGALLYEQWLSSTDPVKTDAMEGGESPTIITVFREKKLGKGTELGVLVVDPQGDQDIVQVQLSLGESFTKIAIQDPAIPGQFWFPEPWRPDDLQGLNHLKIVARDIMGFMDSYLYPVCQ